MVNASRHLTIHLAPAQYFMCPFSINAAASGKLQLRLQDECSATLEIAWLPPEASVTSPVRCRTIGAGEPARPGKGSPDGTEDEAQRARRHRFLRLPYSDRVRHVLRLEASTRIDHGSDGRS